MTQKEIEAILKIPFDKFKTDPKIDLGIYKEFILFSITMARQAGQFLKSQQSTVHENKIDIKIDKTYRSIADKLSSQFTYDILKKYYPDYSRLDE